MPSTRSAESDKTKDLQERLCNRSLSHQSLNKSRIRKCHHFFVNSRWRFLTDDFFLFLVPFYIQFGSKVSRCRERKILKSRTKQYLFIKTNWIPLMKCLTRHCQTKASPTLQSISVSIHPATASFKVRRRCYNKESRVVRLQEKQSYMQCIM